jgi:hypothetical protein
MLSIGKTFAGRCCDGILCFGNTLVHLPDEAAIASFLWQSHQLVNPSGKLLIQILNYEYILDNKITALTDDSIL